MDVLDGTCQRLRQAVNAAVGRIDELGVISHSLIRQAKRAVHDLFERWLRDSPGHPVASNIAQIPLPELLVIGKHEVLRDTGAECMQYPFLKVLRTSIRASAQ